MKIIIADFKIMQYGGIVGYVASMLKAFKDLGCDVDVMQMSPSSITQRAYENKLKDFESGEYQKKLGIQSQCGGYEKDEVTGYWKNNFYGYFLPPSNRIGVYETNAVERWKESVKDADIILWNFMPTKSSDWYKSGKEFNFWWKFFDLPDTIKQIFLCHDAYFNVRASNISALKDKILFIGCAHLAAYHCCSEIGIYRGLLLNPRYMPDGMRMPIKMMNKRKVDYFAAHMFKSMKHMEDLVAAVPYMSKDKVVEIAGSGIEYFYMTSKDKIKSKYVCDSKRDPDLNPELDNKISLWDRAVDNGMKYLGQISNSEVSNILFDCKFAIDPSWCEHYAKYCRTHINGFIIEAMLCGAYPVIRDYRGLVKNEKEVYDPLFESINAIVIPWDATPKQFAEYLDKASKMPMSKYLSDTKQNFDFVYELFNAKNNAKEIIRLANGGKKLVEKELEIGKDSENVKKITKDIMEDFYHIELPIEWEN